MAVRVGMNTFPSAADMKELREPELPSSGSKSKIKTESMPKSRSLRTRGTEVLAPDSRRCRLQGRGARLQCLAGRRVLCGRSGPAHWSRHLAVGLPPRGRDHRVE